MRGTVAKRLRREAQAAGQFYRPEEKYVQQEKGQWQLARFGRKILRVLQNEEGKLTTQVFTMFPQEWSTVKHRDLSVRAIYHQLKRQYYEQKKREK